MSQLNEDFEGSLGIDGLRPIIMMLTNHVERVNVLRQHGPKPEEVNLICSTYCHCVSGNHIQAMETSCPIWPYCAACPDDKKLWNSSRPDQCWAIQWWAGLFASAEYLKSLNAKFRNAYA